MSLGPRGNVARSREDRQREWHNPREGCAKVALEPKGKMGRSQGRSTAKVFSSSRWGARFEGLRRGGELARSPGGAVGSVPGEAGKSSTSRTKCKRLHVESEHYHEAQLSKAERKHCRPPARNAHFCNSDARAESEGCESARGVLDSGAWI